MTEIKQVLRVFSCLPAFLPAHNESTPLIWLVRLDSLFSRRTYVLPSPRNAFPDAPPTRSGHKEQSKPCLTPVPSQK
jgi:hypothetical protein